MIPINDGGILDGVLYGFTNAISGTWGLSLGSYLMPLLLALVTLQFGVIAIEATIARDIPLLLIHILLGIIRVGIVVAIFQHAAEWGNDIVDTGRILGDNISGFGLTPSGVFNAGIGIMQTIWHTKAMGAWYDEPFEKLEFFIVGAGVAFCWLCASVIYLGCLVEASLLVYTGPLVIAFTPLSWTFDMLVTWARYLLGLAFKLALILMTLAVGMTLANHWIANVNATSATFATNMWNLVVCVVESVLFAYCVWRFPTRISGLTTGAASIGFGEAVLGLAGGPAKSARGSAASVAVSAIKSGAGYAGSAAAHGAQALGHQALALAQKVQSKLTS